jgi:acetyl esterase/lipase
MNAMTSPASMGRAAGALLALIAAWPLHAGEGAVIDLWPEGVPGLKADAGPEKQVAAGRVANIHHPSLTVFSPDAGRANGTAVIICPGGSYVRLTVEPEGAVPARWFASRGVKAFVLKYRLSDYGHPAPLRDILRAVRLVRSRAGELGVRPDRIGVLGFSAGGHVAASAGTLFDAPEGRTGAALDAVSARPDFMMLVYPVITMEPPFVHQHSRVSLLGPAPSAELVSRLSLERQVTRDTPPAFLVQSEEDRTVPVENSLLFYQALRNAGVPAELHLYAVGVHGFGMNPGMGPTSGWPDRLEDWMRFHGWLPAAQRGAGHPAAGGL